MNRRRAFTLIELLVVISIIALLSSVVLSSVNAARAKSRDAFVKTSLKEMQKALELYRDKYGSYPPTGCGGAWAYSLPNSIGCANYIDGLDEFMPSLPQGFSTARYFLYSSRSGDSYASYKLMFTGVESETVATTSPWARCPASAACSGGTWCGTNPNHPTVYSIATEGVAFCGY